MGRPLTGKTAEAHAGRTSVLDRFAAKNSSSTGAIADHKESNRQIPVEKTEPIVEVKKTVAAPKPVVNSRVRLSPAEAHKARLAQAAAAKNGGRGF